MYTRAHAYIATDTDIQADRHIRTSNVTLSVDRKSVGDEGKEINR